MDPTTVLVVFDVHGILYHRFVSQKNTTVLIVFDVHGILYGFVSQKNTVLIVFDVRGHKWFLDNVSKQD